jgi:hypothetical protein
MAGIVNLGGGPQRAERGGNAVGAVVDRDLRAEQADPEGIATIVRVGAFGRDTAAFLAAEQGQRPLLQRRGAIEPAGGVERDYQHHAGGE